MTTKKARPDEIPHLILIPGHNLVIAVRKPGLQLEQRILILSQELVVNV